MIKHVFWLLLAIAMFVYGYLEGSGNSRSNTHAPQVHPTTDQAESVPSDLVAPERNRSSDQRHHDMMRLFDRLLTMIEQDVQSRVAQSKENDYNWGMDKTTALRHRLWQAERALHNWPSDKNMDRVFFLRRELRQADKPKPKSRGWNTAQAKWPPVPAN